MPRSGEKWWTVGNRTPEGFDRLDTYFLGEFAHSLDEKGRLAIPAKFRARFKEGAVVTRWIGECLAIFPQDEWESINADIRKRPRTDPLRIEFTHFLVAGAHDAEPDGQGRVVVPAHLREFAGLRSEAVIVGVTDHLEVWEPARWRTRVSQVGAGIGDRLADLGI